jgi:nitrogen-specific signal transduction histidine kinase
METSPISQDPLPKADWLVGDSEMADLIREKNWTGTPLGNRESWPSPLRFSVNTMLSSPFPIAVLWGPQLTLLYNDSYRLIAGDRHPQALGRTVYEAWPEVAHLNRPNFEASMNRGKSVFLENSLFPLRRNRGPIEDAWFTFSCSPIHSETGKITGTLVILIETTAKVVSDRKIEEEKNRFKRFIENTPAAVALFDQEMRIAYASKRYISDLHIQDPDYHGKRAVDLIPSMPGQWQSSHQECISGSAGNKGEELIERLDGSGDWIKWEMTPWFDEKGCPDGVLWASDIINDRKRLEDDLRATIEIRDEFMSVASHELKNPLTALKLQLTLMEQHMGRANPPIDSRITRLNGKALQSVAAIESLIDTLMDVTRIRAGKLRIELEEVDLSSLVREAVQGVTEEANQRGCTITMGPSKVMTGAWDPLRIRQVLLNLLTNAIKYGAGKPIHVEILENPLNGHARIKVQDAGIGIPTALQKKIFDRFERGAAADQIKGLGLGLYIAKQIVTAHCGTIQVQSEPSKGSLFIVDLPIRPPLDHREGTC